MLAAHLKHADALKQNLNQQFVDGEHQVIQAAENFSDTLLTATNHNVSAAYQAERQIEFHLRNIERLLASNANQNAQWLSLLDRLTTQLKELGDMTNWLQHLQSVAEHINHLAKSL